MAAGSPAEPRSRFPMKVFPVLALLLAAAASLGAAETPRTFGGAKGKGSKSGKQWDMGKAGADDE